MSIKKEHVMQYALVAFRSRNQTAKMYEIFLANGIFCKIINTPKEANVGCGISIRFDLSQLQNAKQLVGTYQQQSFIGFFKVTVLSGRYLVKHLC